MSPFFDHLSPARLSFRGYLLFACSPPVGGSGPGPCFFLFLHISVERYLIFDLSRPISINRFVSLLTVAVRS